MSGMKAPKSLPSLVDRVDPPSYYNARGWNVFRMSSDPSHSGWAFCIECEKEDKIKWLKCDRKAGTNSINKHFDKHIRKTPIKPKESYLKRKREPNPPEDPDNILKALKQSIDLLWKHLDRQDTLLNAAMDEIAHLKEKLQSQEI